MTQPVTQRTYLVSSATGTIFPTIIKARAPNTTDFDYPITQRWIDTSDSNAEWFLLNFTTSAGVVSPNWVQLSSGSLTTETLTGNTGLPVGPTGNNINVIGDVVSGISIAGNPGTSTLTATLANIPNSSLANSSITLVAGTGISITVSPVSLGGSTTISTTAELNSFNQINIRVFETVGASVYTPTANTKYVIVECQGGGGGSGGVGAPGAGQVAVSGGGGGGGYARKFLTVAAATGQTMTVGAGGTAGSSAPSDGAAGGTTSFGALCVATGGAGNSSTAPDALAFMLKGEGAAGGVGTTGDVLVNGSSGGYGCGSGTTNQRGSGIGGASYFGAGGGTSSGAAIAGKLYGGGAGGAGAISGSGAFAGAAGAKGVIVITEFISV